MRGRLIFVFYAEFVRLDVAAMTAGSPDVDQDFREARAIATALELDPDERGRRAKALAHSVRRADVSRWVADQLSDIDRLPRLPTGSSQREVTP